MYNVETVQDWITHDPSEETKAELTELLAKAEGGDEAAKAELTDRFTGSLQFGTAGLRGAMAAGPNRMNRAVVRRAAYGLTSWLQKTVGKDALVVIGFDARYHSNEFAADTAAIVTAMGSRAMIMPRHLPTPLLAFAVRHLGADAGVMVTASHNPAQDNGYKVYVGARAVEEDGRGVQIVPPIDAGIAAEIAAAPLADEIELAEGGWETISEDVIDAYVEQAISVVPADGPRDLRIVYTPMHGVGGEIMKRVLDGAGFTDYEMVPEQAQPDPDFPTVSFPNPEEKGALDLAITLAKKNDADLVIASDPDADRASLATKVNGEWRQLSGDEIGSLLGEYVATRDEGKDVALASSIVSSQLLGKIAEGHGLKYHATLTGFKWIARTHKITFGYEEAIGFCVDPNHVRDKDGLSAGVTLAHLAASLKAEGKELADELDRIHTRYGVYLTTPVTIRVSDLSIIPATMAKLRKEPPTELGGSPVRSIEDLSKGTEELPGTDALRIFTENNSRVMVRPSGTEPKLKCYLEVVVPVEGDLAAARATAAERMDAFKADVEAMTKLD
ncbi:phospho-sugar mutase [Arcanobacterium wilhelmae]|uniref:phospho-sugar mutase n=1 Tax=Arcanobacterium wilhelmae TaxID=1803177 RepID=UPI0024154527|nr:phospho-sugar mutase [Arcanobacterium wilhelmae]WFN90805.1 phospho-sugar mutase [Arcanobacterium wilhelmae]